MIGAFQAENITGAFAMAKEVANLSPEKIIQSIAKFQGIKRRLQKRLDGEITVIDDIAHSPEKSLATLKELREIYDAKIIAVYEPNIGSRRIEIKEKYNNAFSNADYVFIPRLTKLKIGEEELKPLEGEELTEIISETHQNVIYEPDDEKLIEKIIQIAKPGDAIIFLGSHGFRGMIEDLILKLK